jgi:hypothetical protein
MPPYFADPKLDREQRCARLWKSFHRCLELLAYTQEDIGETFSYCPRYERDLMRYKLLVTTDFLKLWGHDKGREALHLALEQLTRAPLAPLAPGERDRRIEQRRNGPQLEPPTELITATECPVGLFLEKIRKHQVRLEPVDEAEPEAEKRQGSPTASPTGGT